MARVTLSKIDKIYPGVEKPAVQDATIEITDGEFMVLVGPSGCGKSTTLRMIAGLEEATSGDIHIGERRVNDIAPKDRDIAMIFQNYALYPHMTVYENMAFGLRMRKTAKAEIDRRVREVAETIGLTSYLNRKPKALSGGQRQRVALGRAIVREPAVFLFDEPLSNLDAKMRITMRNEIRRLHRELKTTMIYVTHDQVEAMTMGDRITVLDDGFIQQIDTPGNVYKNPKNLFVAGFIGSPPMNFFTGRVADDGGKTLFKSGAIAFELPSPMSKGLNGNRLSELVFGIRPEDITEAEADSQTATCTFEGKVENREPLGAETMLYIKVGDAQVVIRIAGDATDAVGSTKRLTFDPAAGHLFDAASGERVG